MKYNSKSCDSRELNVLTVQMETVLRDWFNVLARQQNSTVGKMDVRPQSESSSSRQHKPAVWVNGKEMG